MGAKLNLDDGTDQLPKDKQKQAPLNDRLYNKPATQPTVIQQLEDGQDDRLDAMWIAWQNANDARQLALGDLGEAFDISGDPPVPPAQPGVQILQPDGAGAEGGVGVEGGVDEQKQAEGDQPVPAIPVLIPDQPQEQPVGAPAPPANADQVEKERRQKIKEENEKKRTDDFFLPDVNKKKVHATPANYRRILTLTRGTGYTLRDLEPKPKAELVKIVKEYFSDELPEHPTDKETDEFVLNWIENNKPERGRPKAQPKPPNVISKVKSGTRKGQWGDGIEQLKHVQQCGMNSDEIEKVLSSKLHHAVPVIAADELHTLLPTINSKTQRVGVVINSQDHQLAGQHWRAIYIDRKKAEVCYFDALVSEPTAETLKGIKQIVEKMHDPLYYKLKINRFKRQANDTSTCGAFSIKFLEDMYAGKKFKEASGFQDQHVEGEKQIDKFISTWGHV